MNPAITSTSVCLRRLRDAVDLLIVAGEHSGDEHAARVVRELLAPIIPG